MKFSTWDAIQLDRSFLIIFTPSWKVWVSHHCYDYALPHNIALAFPWILTSSWYSPVYLTWNGVSTWYKGTLSSVVIGTMMRAGGNPYADLSLILYVRPCTKKYVDTPFQLTWAGQYDNTKELFICLWWLSVHRKNRVRCTANDLRLNEKESSALYQKEEVTFLHFILFNLKV